MSLRHVMSAVLLFAASAGWAFAPLPTGSSDRPAVLRQLTDRLGVLPPVCVLLGVAALLAGMHSRPDGEAS
ncbi:hypothetical protein [Limnoglobus roseus]|uniref:Uncharacterized protein n=1 Tax=Limnoglobus roseus TaxID=2598579 RepID=A0A5C1AL62_9BACT|nr:hypothetical protein [Limnoglobus roseus]QEL17924.1 hypothetical protein PX52LOC_04936 [Limnoglobus roseus]